MADATMLGKVKKALGIEGTYQDDTIGEYVDEVTSFLTEAGVKAENVTPGIVARGVTDLWETESSRITSSRGRRSFPTRAERGGRTMKDFNPSYPYSTPIELLIPTYSSAKGVPTKTFPASGIRLNCSWFSRTHTSPAPRRRLCISLRRIRCL